MKMCSYKKTLCSQPLDTAIYKMKKKKSCLISYPDQTRWSTSATFHHLVTFYNSVFINLKEKVIHLAVIQIKYGDNEKNLTHSKRFP